MPIPLGVLAVAGAGGGGAPPGPAFDLLTTTVVSTATSTVTFSSLNTYTNYRNLEIRGIARSDFNNASGLLQDIRVRFNGDTGNNYVAHRLAGYGSSVNSQTDGANANHIRVGEAVAAGDTPSNIFSGSIISILEFSSTNKNKTIRTIAGTHNPNESAVVFQSGMWNNTAALTSIDLTSAFGNFVSGTRFSLYGIRG